MTTATSTTPSSNAALRGIAAAPISRSNAATQLRAIAIAWLLAGTLDILAAIVTSGLKGVPALSVLKAIASGVLGVKAFKGGLDMAALGLALHFFIMLGIAAVYWGMSQRLRLLITHPLPCGLVYGVAVYAVMNLIVLPMSAIAFKPNYSWSSLTTGIVVHMLCVGLPVAWAIARFGARR